MTQQEFAARLDISPASLSSIFNGRTNPTNNHVQAIHRAFPNININWLLFGEGDMLLSPMPGNGATEGQKDLVGEGEAGDGWPEGHGASADNRNPGFIFSEGDFEPAAEGEVDAGGGTVVDGATGVRPIRFRGESSADGGTGHAAYMQNPSGGRNDGGNYGDGGTESPFSSSHRGASRLGRGSLGTGGSRGRYTAKGEMDPDRGKTIANVNIIDRPMRKIKEIRVFFDDGTYEAFVPSSK